MQQQGLRVLYAGAVGGMLTLLGCGSSAGGHDDDGGSGSAEAGTAEGADTTDGASGDDDDKPEPGDSTLPPGTCGLDQPAFCDDFENLHAGGYSGPLDESRWKLSRYGHHSTQFFVRSPASTLPDVELPPTFCGAPFEGLLPPDDVSMCQGVGVEGVESNQLNEVFGDHGGFGYNSMMIRQPFDFEGRTGTIVFDVDAKFNPHNVGHGWWIELWVTQDPAPLPYHEAPTVLAYPRNGIGLSFQGFGDCDKSGWTNQLEVVTVTRDHQVLHSYAGQDFDFESWEDRCFQTADAVLNRFEIHLSRDAVEVWVSQAGESSVRHLATAENLDLDFEFGYVHLQHSHYNARKDGNVTPYQTYRWDNVGFDGPTYAPLRGYDVPDRGAPAQNDGALALGYELGGGSEHTFELQGVDTTGLRRAFLDMSAFGYEGSVIEYRLNGGEWAELVVPHYGLDNGQQSVRSLSTPVPIEQIVDGTNTITLRQLDAGAHDQIANIDLSLEVDS